MRAMLDEPNHMFKTIIAFDFGTHRIGSAVGQTITVTAQPLSHIPAHHGKPDWLQVSTLLQEWQPSRLIVGLPLNMDGSEQPLTTMARNFAQGLKGRFNIPVELYDERLSTREARTQLFERRGYRALTKGKIDSIAAALILEGWFATHLPC